MRGKDTLNFLVSGTDGVLGANRQTTTAAHAFIRVDGGLAIFAKPDRVVDADLREYDFPQILFNRCSFRA